MTRDSRTMLALLSALAIALGAAAAHANVLDGLSANQTQVSPGELVDLTVTMLTKEKCRARLDFGDGSPVKDFAMSTLTRTFQGHPYTVTSTASVTGLAGGASPACTGGTHTVLVTVTRASGGDGSLQPAGSQPLPKKVEPGSQTMQKRGFGSKPAGGQPIPKKVEPGSQVMQKPPRIPIPNPRKTVETRLLKRTDPEVQVDKCDNSADYNACQPPYGWAGGTLNGSHRNNIIGGGAFGTDTFTIRLHDGWVFSRVSRFEKTITGDDGDFVRSLAPALPIGGTTWKGSIYWHATADDSVKYQIDIEVTRVKGLHYES